MTDRREFIKLDVNYLDNPKVAPLVADGKVRAVLLHIECIAYSRRNRKNGIVPIAVVRRRIGATKGDVDTLIAAGLLVDCGAGAVEVHDYLEHQESREQIEARADAARNAANARWGNA